MPSGLFLATCPGRLKSRIPQGQSNLGKSRTPQRKAEILNVDRTVQLSPENSKPLSSKEQPTTDARIAHTSSPATATCAHLLTSAHAHVLPTLPVPSNEAWTCP